MKLHRSKILGGPQESTMAQYTNPELLAMQNDSLLNQEQLEKEAMIQRMIMQRKALIDQVSSAGLLSDQRKPPVEMRFDMQNYSIRGLPQPQHNNQSVALSNQNRMMALL